MLEDEFFFYKKKTKFKNKIKILKNFNKYSEKYLGILMNSERLLALELIQLWKENILQRFFFVF